MSKESMSWLNSYVLIGNTDERGKAWHYLESEQGTESNHYAGSIPVEDLNRRLFGWSPIFAPLSVDVVTADDVYSVADPTRKVVVRPAHNNLDPAVMGVFKNSYDHAGYSVSLVDAAEKLGGDGVNISSAGLLREGAQAWVQFMPTAASYVEGVSFMPYVTIADSMDGSLAYTFITGAQVAVCDNTLSAALGSATSKFKVRHTKNSVAKITDAADALGLLREVEADFTEQVTTMTKHKVSDAELMDFMDLWSPLTKDMTGRAQTFSENKRDSALALYKNDERVSPWAGTAYGVLAMANTWQHHESIVRGASRGERNYEAMVNGKFDQFDAEIVKLIGQATEHPVFA